ncbi:hypothetical protein [Corynebacterium halotolerans]|uniref:Uncharacterized protein n=1 Tax=Corynebacterium halotolerans YIM 70093 = DSM 44683 TaxID=1121362 RepID=M1NXT2_9CORY|nr:hypothetical protein [Corynebacterium halotolerans]AGF72310.1 hypothetical protein A605_06540 [Corynebacterium halotolerans YIM 70093 = DSM 44683]
MPTSATRSGMPGIVVIHGGTHSQLATLADPALQVYRITPVHVRHVHRHTDTLHSADVIVVADRLRRDLLLDAAPHLLAAHDNGTDLVVLGENHAGEWVPGITHDTRPTIFWWWRTGEDSRIRPVAPEHPAWEIFSRRSTVWHYHGVVHGGPAATSLVDLLTPEGERDGSLLLVDESRRARLLVATMDPFYHHGSGFMPGATQLLHAVLQWATRPGDREGTR